MAFIMEGELTMLENLASLQAESVRIKNRPNVLRKIRRLIDGGEDRLQVISDFDRTMTRAHYDDRECESSFGLFHLCPSLPDEYLRKAEVFYEQYRPIELDSSVCADAKAVYMEEWIHKEASLLNFPLPKNELMAAVSRSNVRLRDNLVHMLNLLRSCGVPVLIHTPALGDTVVAVLKQEEALQPNMHVIANFLHYKGKNLDGLRGGLLHTCNQVDSYQYFRNMHERHNVLVMGDMLGDAEMAKDVHHANTILKIGFLQDGVADNLDAYMDAFDIVLIDDQTMDCPYNILQVILD